MGDRDAEIGRILKRLAILETREDPDTGWLDVTYNTGWEDFGGSLETVQYRKVGNFVYLRGVCKRTSGTDLDICNLPSGFRPLSHHRTIAVYANTASYCYIRSDGDVEAKGSETYTVVNLQAIWAID